ncbi:MAG TPA: hypothetical protein VF631_05205 [Allosphingosinicella sp.]|uniref:hypothetical protein n=1 Tax=Allosphingosinicella sp. TaxID=2823234 RepID=UPI002F281176
MGPVLAGSALLMGSGSQTEADEDAFEKQQKDFYAAVGILVTNYQFAEDHLQVIFALLLEADEVRARIAFGAVRGLGAKLSVIADLIAVSGNANNAAIWKSLSKRLGRAADARNEVAHGKSTMFGGTISFQVDEATNTMVGPKSVTLGEMQMRKPTRVGENIWNVDRMWREIGRTRTLRSDLYSFGRLLASQG